MRRLFFDSLILAALFLLVCAVVSCAKPAKNIPAPPNLDATKCQFGDITQRGRRVSIAGPHWSAEGEIRDGYLFVEWISIASGRSCLGLYKLGEERLEGHYGHDAVYTGPPWEICSENGVIGEVLYVSRPMPEGIDQ